MAPTELELLLHALEDRDLPLGAEDVAWAFEDESTRQDASGWVNEYLRPATLLTKDELAFLERAGERAFVAYEHHDVGRPISDAEYESAIASLEASTAAIDQQCEILESQKQALKEIQSRNAADDAIASIQDKRQSKRARQGAQLDFEVDELAQALQSRLRASSKQGDVATSALPSAVERLLEKDDRLLDGLQKLLPKLADDLPNQDETVNVEHLCSTLTALSVREIHARLDKTYRDCVSGGDTLQDSSSEQQLTASQMKQRKTLQIELEELSSEVEGLASIVVDHQHRKPLKTGMLSAIAGARAQKSKWFEYTIEALTYLTARLDALAEHIDQLYAQNKALRIVSGTLDEIIITRESKSGSSNNNSSPMTPTSHAKGLKPLRLVQANLSESQDPAIPFLREHEIRAPDEASNSKLLNTFFSAVHDRKRRLAHLSSSTEETVSEALAKSLTRAEGDMQDLVNAVHSHSKYGSTHLVDNTVQCQMDELEHRTHSLGERMRDVDTEAIAKALRTKQAEAVQSLAGE